MTKFRKLLLSLKGYEIKPIPKHKSFIDRTGDKIGIITVLAYLGKEGRAHYWVVVCECGNIRKIPNGSFKNAYKSKNCFCNAARGLRSSGAYKSFMSAKKRCTDKSDKDYPRYGGKGVEFRYKSVQHLVDDIGKRPEGLTLDRIKNDGHYEPGNCRWATVMDQNYNRGVSIKIGDKTLKQIADENGIPYVTAYWRYKNNKPIF